MTPPKSNPIAQRLDGLRFQWTTFAKHSDARLLRWLVAPDEVEMVDAFIATESEPETCETPDMFLRFDEAFELPEAHGFVLRESFIKQYEEIRAALQEAGADASFVAPHAQASDDDVRAFVRLLKAFHAHPGGDIALLAVLLLPEDVRDTAAYQLWLHRLLREAPAELRFIVLDAIEAPSFSALAEAEPLRVVSTPCDLDMAGALTEVSAQSGLDIPGGHLRHLLVHLANAAKKQD